MKQGPAPPAGFLIEVSGQDREKKALRQFCATPLLLDEAKG